MNWWNARRAPYLKPPTSRTPASTGPKETSSAQENDQELPRGSDQEACAETVTIVTDTSFTCEDNAADQPKPRPLSLILTYTHNGRGHEASNITASISGHQSLGMCESNWP
ncbi:hypothetical protein F2Q70_00036980 [Brassica cretica]|uniref:Uncharacterized protein n=1 Tax=Brassica cretica TaxID=69181 RepID=A0A8S9JPW6_BRACR|nr:hypothetical protein F2Q70_00036980 [Brassica cretica]